MAKKNPSPAPAVAGALSERSESKGTVTTDTSAANPPPAVTLTAPPEAAPEVPTPGLEVIADRSAVLIVAEGAPGRKIYIYDFVPGRGILASNKQASALPMNKPRAQAILKDVRKEYPNAQIQFVD